jgi:alkylhydroperoxidase/carboxymuconolactone decarboxylase family protein YurZ
MPDDTIDRDAIKARFIAERGYWRPWTDALLRHNPRFLERYAAYAGHPARVGPLAAKQVELIYVALDASSTHLFAPGLKTHMEKALAAGATPQEILDVLHLVAAQGLDSVYQAVAILAEERDRVTAERGAGSGPHDAAGDAPSAPGPELLARIRHLNLPVAPAAMSLMNELDPGYLPVLLDVLEHGRPEEGLADDDRALIEVALFACFTGHDPQALRQRIRRALDAELPPAALLQAIQLGAHLSVHGTALGAETMAELLHPGARPGAGASSRC